MELVKSLKKAFGRKFCNICLSEGRVSKFDNLELCESCIENVKEKESESPVKISKEQNAGGIKDEL